MAETADVAPAKPGPTVAALTADALLEPWFACLKDQLADLRIFDCHTHLGCADPDGSCFDVDELVSAVEVVDGRAVVFPLAEPDSYRAANDRTLALAQAAGGRLVPFCRVDPRDGALEEAKRAIARGAAGIKLHPRAERFGLTDPAAIARTSRVRRLGGGGGGWQCDPGPGTTSLRCRRLYWPKPRLASVTFSSTAAMFRPRRRGRTCAMSFSADPAG